MNLLIFNCPGQLSRWSCHWLIEWVKLLIAASSDYNDYNDLNDYNNYTDYRDNDLDLDWERFRELVAQWHSWLFLTNCKTWITTLRFSDWQSDSDLDCIRYSCNVACSRTSTMFGLGSNKVTETKWSFTREKFDFFYCVTRAPLLLHRSTIFQSMS